MRRLSILLGTSLYLVLSAESALSHTALVEEGMQYHQAQEYSKAIDLYKKALDLPIKSIDRDIINYNLAISYLESAQYDLAICGFKEVIENKERLPGYIYERSCYNLILSHLKKVNSFINQELALESKEQVNQIQKHLQNAHTYYQFLIDYKNRNLTIVDQQWIEKIRQAIKELHSKLDEKIKQIDLKNLTLITGLKSLKQHLKDQLICLETLIEKEFDLGFSKYFLEKCYAKEKEEVIIWERIDQLCGETLVDKHQQTEKKEMLFDEKESFLKSYHYFLTALDRLKEGDAFQSHLLLHHSLLIVDLLMSQSQGDDIIEYGLKQREQTAGQLNNDITKSALKSLRQQEYGHLCHLVSESIEKWAKNNITSDEQNKKLKTFVAKELTKNLSDMNLIALNLCFQDSYLYQSYPKKIEELILPLYLKLDGNQKKLDDYEIDRLQVVSKLLGYYQTSLEDDKIKKSYQEEQVAINHLQDLLKDQQLTNAYQHLVHLLINYHFSPFMIQKLNELSESFSFLAQDIKINPQQLENLNFKFGQVLELEKEIVDPTKRAKDFNEVKQKLLKSKENLGLVEFKQEREVLNQLLVEDSLADVNRLIYDLTILELSIVQRLEQGLCDQKHTLKLTTTYQSLDQPLFDMEEYLLKLSVASQSYPLQDVKGLAALIELQMMEAKENKASLQNMLEHFKKGEIAAQKAERLLKNTCIVWDEVIDLEKQVIEHWTKALEVLKEQPPQAKNESKKNDQNQDFSSELANDDLQEQSREKMQESNRNNEELENKKSEALLRLLEQLNEMQQDDQEVVKHPNKTLKKGLRPW